MQRSEKVALLNVQAEAEALDARNKFLAAVTYANDQKIKFKHEKEVAAKQALLAEQEAFKLALVIEH